MQLMQVDGPMARSIHDLRVSYQIMSGRHIGDPRSVDAPLVGAEGKKKVGLVVDAHHVETPEATRVALRQASENLMQQGYEVTPIQLPELSQVNQLWERLFTKDVSEMLRNLQPLLSRPVHLFLADMARLCPLDFNYQALFVERARLQTLWSEFFAPFDAVLTPTWTQLPWPVDADLVPDIGIQLLHDTTPFLTPANVLGLPAVAMPMGVSGGLPTGIQVMADLWREDLCLEVAENIERGVSFPWLFKV
jgi:amidase